MIMKSVARNWMRSWKSREAIGLKGGVYGCRMTGGGFGGCAVALVKTEAVDSITKKISAGLPSPKPRLRRLFVSRPAAGATVS